MEETMLRVWRDLVEPAVTGESPAEEPTTCREWRSCCCQHAADGHCWACGKKQGEHPGYGGDEEPTWPGNKEDEDAA